MAYTIPSFPSGRDVLAKYNEHKLRDFKLNQDETFLKLTPVSNVPWITAQSKQVQYEKETCTLLKTSSNTIDVIKKDDEFHSFIWHTTAANLKKGVRYGIVKTQSVTGQVISTLGQYRLITLDRIKDGYVSNRYLLKKKLLTHYQKRFELLEELESLANQNVPEMEFRHAFDRYIKNLTEIQTKLDAYFTKTKFSEVDRDGINHLKSEIQEDIAKAKHFMRHYSREAANRATGVDSVLTFVKSVMIRNLREMQNHNQNITYSRKLFYAATRGDLNSCIEDAEKIIEDYEVPPRDSVYADNHGCYGSGDERVAYDSSYHCTTGQQEQRALLAITFIEKMNKVVLLDSPNQKATLQTKNTNKKQSELKTVTATKWHVSGGGGGVFKRILAWIANISIKLVFGIVELPLTILVEPLMFGHFSGFFHGVRKLATREITVKNNDAPALDGQESFLSSKTQRETMSLGLRLRHLTANAFKNSFQDIWSGARDIYKQFAIHLFDNIYDDYADGEKKKQSLDEVLRAFNNEISEIAIHENRVRENLFPDHQVPKEQKKVKLDEQFASPTFIPTGWKPNDALNSSASATDAFMSLFMHHIYAKHPFAGLLFTLTYAAGGLAVLAPNVVSFLGPQFIAYSQNLGFGMSQSPLTAAISSGCTQAQMASSVFEMIIHGPKSWVATNAVEFEKDPFTSLIYVATAVGFGYLVVYQLNVPWLSEMLKDDMGTFPPSSLAFVGAKLGVLVYELLEESEHEHLEKTDKNKNLKEYLTELYKKSHPDVTEPALLSEKVDKVMNDLQQQTTAEALRNKFKKLKLMHELTANHDRLLYLSAKTKHHLVQQMNELNFTSADVRSLKKLLYPEEKMSILRTTLAIIIGYPAFLIRLAVACVSSIIQRSPKPLLNAAVDFGYKIVEDVARVGRACSKYVKVTSLFIRRMIKTVADVFMNTVLARGEALVFNTHHIANGSYTISGRLDALYEKARQLFSTVVDAAIKFINVAHPMDTERKSEASYVKLFSKLEYNYDNNDTSSQEKTPIKIIQKNTENTTIHRLTANSQGLSYKAITQISRK